MEQRLQDKVAVVTAGSSGFGRGIATLFAQHGAQVVIGDLDEQPRAGGFDARPELSTAALIEAAGGRAWFQHCDVTRQADAAQLIASAVERCGRLDILVNNAGVYRGGRRMHEMTEADLDACWNVSARGSWLCSQEAIKRFLAQDDGGSIINILSTAALRAHPMQTPYNMAKAAQASLTRCLALEYGRHGIRVNGICPTYAKTAMSRAAHDHKPLSDRVRKVIPLGRWAEVSDVANLALFLASEEGSFMQGALIPLDGGEILSGLVHQDADG
jgi:NAD(P)-dependent dehydrogenase (short-subunit alcohol dehydrogenase family)